VRPRAVAGLTRRELPEGESVALTADQSRAVVLNAVGSVVLELCDGRLSEDDIVRLLRERWVDVAATRLEADVRRFLTDLAAAGMIEDLDA
jgi:hypothetical protein